MNVFELALVIVILAAGIWCGNYLGSQYGVAGWIGGFLTGCLLSIASYVALLRLVDVWYVWRPLRPICKNGTCPSDKYEVIEVDIDSREATFQCSCGTKYVGGGRQFMELLEDGARHPYMKREGFTRKWENDRTVAP